MSWISHNVGEDDEIKAMRMELEKQQQEATRILLEKQQKKEQQLLQRQRRRKEQQSIRQDQQQQRQQQSAEQQSTLLTATATAVWPKPPKPPRQKQSRKTSGCDSGGGNKKNKDKQQQQSSPSGSSKLWSIPGPSSSSAAAASSSSLLSLSAGTTGTSGGIVMSHSHTSPSKFLAATSLLSSSKDRDRSGSLQQMYNFPMTTKVPTVSPAKSGGKNSSGDPLSPLLGPTRTPPRSSESSDMSDVDKKHSDQLIGKGLTLMELSRFQGEYASDEDAMEADHYEPLARHGEYFTREEVIRLYRSKLNHLKSMYLHQSEFVKMAFKEKRRLYLNAVEELQVANISYTSDPSVLIPGKNKVSAEYIMKQTDEFKRMKALKKYQKYKGSRAVLRMKAKQIYEESVAAAAKKKAETDKFLEPKKPKFGPGFFSGPGSGAKSGQSDTESADETDEGSDEEEEDLFELFREARRGRDELKNKATPTSTSSRNCAWESDEFGLMKCQQLALPLTKYCCKHILKDERQTLFKRCGRPLGNSEGKCQVPVMDLMEKLGCQLHRIPVVKEELEPANKKKERLRQETQLPVASVEVEVEALEDLIANQIFNLAQFDEAVKCIEAKGLRSPDTDDSDEEGEGDGGGGGGDLPLGGDGEGEIVE